MEKKTKYKDPPQFKLIETIEGEQRKKYSLLVDSTVKSMLKKIKTWTN